MNRIRLPLAALAVATLLAACGTTGAGGGTADPTTADVTVTAADMAFAPEGITVASAGEPFTVALVNDDTMPHNIAIYTDETKSEKLFEGDMVTDGTIVYEIPALDAGEYFLDCSLHPTMTGTLVVEG